MWSISCSVNATFRITRPACAARSRTSLSSVGVIDSPGRFTIDSAPSSSPWCRIGSRISVADTSPASSSVAAIGGNASASCGHRPSETSWSPMRTHTSARTAPVPPASARAIRGQELLVRVRVAEPFGELREHLVRCGALPVDEPVGEPLGTPASRLERERDDRRGDGGQDRIRAAPDERADADDDRDVDDGDEHGERTEQQRAVDHDVDVEQVVPQHRHADRDRDQAEREDRDVLQDGHPAGLVARAPGPREADQQGDACRGSRRSTPPSRAIAAAAARSPRTRRYRRHQGDERTDHSDREHGDAGDRDREHGAQPARRRAGSG